METEERMTDDEERQVREICADRRRPAEPEAVALARVMVAEAEAIADHTKALIRDRLLLDMMRQSQKTVALRIEVALYAGKDEKAVGANAEARARALQVAIAEHAEYQRAEQALTTLRDEMTVRASHLDELREVNKARAWLIRALTPGGGQA
jgi:uncharacterized protein YggU (UPF0235/DUF167 family)